VGEDAANKDYVDEAVGDITIPTATAATATTDGTTAGIVKLAADSNTTSRITAATPAGVAAQVSNAAAANQPFKSYSKYSFNTTYTNSSGKTILVTVADIHSDALGMYINGVLVGTYYFCGAMCVPNGATWRVNSGTVDAYTTIVAYT
jgi:hypothetical protein